MIRNWKCELIVIIRNIRIPIPFISLSIVIKQITISFLIKIDAYRLRVLCKEIPNRIKLYIQYFISQIIEIWESKAKKYLKLDPTNGFRLYYLNMKTTAICCTYEMDFVLIAKQNSKELCPFFYTLHFFIHFPLISFAIVHSFGHIASVHVKITSNQANVWTIS